MRRNVKRLVWRDSARLPSLLRLRKYLCRGNRRGRLCDHDSDRRHHVPTILRLYTRWSTAKRLCAALFRRIDRRNVEARDLVVIEAGAMQTPSYWRPLVAAAAPATLLVAVASFGACGHTAQTVAPSAMAANPSSYDQQDVTVSGMAKNPRTRQTRRGAATTYQLCDSACINVVQFGSANVSDGSKQTVSGRFRATFGRQRRMTNVLIVGGRMGT